MKFAMQNCMTELSMVSGKTYRDPFNEIEVDMAITDPNGEEQLVPAFWAGDNVWRVRFSTPLVGRHSYRTVCSDNSNQDLHGREGYLEVTPYIGSNRLLMHGRLRMSQDRRHLEHKDGTPFLWLADTWWMGLVKRLGWPEEFQMLAADRVAKGFSVIQIIAGLYPDMPPFDDRGANEAGFPWEQDYSRVNPAYFDMADLRIGWLVASGLVPCIVGCWGYFIDFAGVEAIRKHWRYLLARYGAYPVVWCMAGEVLMPYYLNEKVRTPQGAEEYRVRARRDWSDVTRYLRSIDPYKHPITAHSGGGDGSRNMVDEDLVDIDLLQTGHGDRESIPNTVRQVVRFSKEEPRIPVIDGEVCYEGIVEASRQEVQRFMFWACMLSGAAGHTYGANGIWQVNTKAQPFGPSPHGSSWGDTPWEEACKLPGSSHVGIGKRLLERYQWWRFEPHPEWAEPHAGEENYVRPYAAGIPGEVRLLFIPGFAGLSAVKGIEPGVNYKAFYFDPKNGREYPLGDVTPDSGGDWAPPKPVIFQDWVLVLERVRL
ncbi:MAG: DUF4038 domain-containing protein [Firmicutes bacterium]|nr:DUF4038 domain-containing protein [Bacillota bacterium]